MAEKKTIELDVQSNLGSLRSQLKEAQADVASLAEKFGATSKEATDAAKKAAKLKDAIGDAKDLTDAFNPDAKFGALTKSLGGAMDGFQAVQGAMGLFGAESEDVEKALLKVQSAMALSQGIQGVMESVSSFKTLIAQVQAFTLVQKISTALQWLWNTAMAANPVMAIVAAIAAVLAIGYKLISWLMESSQANEDAAAATKRNTEALNKQKAAADKAGDSLKEKNGHEYNMAKAAGASAEALRKLALKHADEQIALEEASVATARNTYEKEQNILASYKMAGMSDEVIAKQRELVTKTREALKEEYADLKEAYKHKRDVINQNQVEIQQELTDRRKKEIELEKEKNDKILENQKEAHDKSIEALEEIKKNNRDATDLFKAEYDKQVRDITEKYDAQIKLAKQYKKDTTDLEAAKNKELQDLADHQIDTTRLGLEKVAMLQVTHLDHTKEMQEQEKKGLVGVAEVKERIALRDKELDEEQKQRQKDKLDLALKYAQTFGQTMGSLNNLLNAQDNERLKSVKKGSKEEDAIKRKMFDRDKKLRIVQTIIDTASNVVQSVRNGGGIPAGIPFGIAAGAMGAFQVAAINKVKYDGGDNSVSSSSGGGTGAGGGSVMSPSFNVVGNSGINQLAQLQQQPTKAYVVSGDVTSAQSLDRNRIENATLVK